jgi:hypothetical protein
MIGFFSHPKPHHHTTTPQTQSCNAVTQIIKNHQKSSNHPSKINPTPNQK